MGMHPCAYCWGIGDFDNSEHIYAGSSSGDITLWFPNGDAYMMPDMVLHYVFDHQWLPAKEFIDDVLRFRAEEVRTERLQTKGLASREPVIMSIGYLSGEFPKGMVSLEFKMRLVTIIETAAKDYPWMVAPKKDRRKNG